MKSDVFYLVTEEMKEKMNDTISEYIARYKAGGDEHVDSYILLVLAAGI